MSTIFLFFTKEAQYCPVTILISLDYLQRIENLQDQKLLMVVDFTENITPLRDSPLVSGNSYLFVEELIDREMRISHA